MNLFDEAQKKYEKVLSEQQSHPDRYNALMARANLGNIYGRRQEFPKAIKMLRSAFNDARVESEMEDARHIAINLLYYLLENGEYHQARQVIDGCEELGAAPEQDFSGIGLHWMRAKLLLAEEFPGQGDERSGQTPDADEKVWLPINDLGSSVYERADS